MFSVCSCLCICLYMLSLQSFLSLSLLSLAALLSSSDEHSLPCLWALWIPPVDHLVVWMLTSVEARIPWPRLTARRWHPPKLLIIGRYSDNNIYCSNCVVLRKNGEVVRNDGIHKQIIMTYPPPTSSMSSSSGPGLDSGSLLVYRELVYISILCLINICLVPTQRSTFTSSCSFLCTIHSILDRGQVIGE